CSRFWFLAVPHWPVTTARAANSTRALPAHRRPTQVTRAKGYSTPAPTAARSVLAQAAPATRAPGAQIRQAVQALTMGPLATRTAAAPTRAALAATLAAGARAG